MAGLVPAISVFVIPAKAGIQKAPTLEILRCLGYWIARIIKLVLGLAKPDPSAGQ